MTSPLRIGLLLDSTFQPRWVQKIIADIQSSDIAQVAAVVMSRAPDEAQNGHRTRWLQKLIRSRRDLLYLLYRKVDERLFRAEPNAFELVDVRNLVQDCQVIPVKPIQKTFSDYLEAEDFQAIIKADLDVALRFGFRILRGDFLKIARYGVWSYHHGDNLVNRGGPPGFWEVMEGDPLTGSVLQVLTEKLDGGKILYRSYSATDRHSVFRNKNNYYWKSSGFVIRKLKDLHERGSLALVEDKPNSPFQPYSHRLYRQPHNLEMVPLLWRWASRYTKAKWLYTVNRYQWFLAYQISRSSNSAPVLYRFQTLLPPKDRFWADPFPVKRGKKFYIFIEEYLYQTGKGHIAMIELDAEGNWQAPVKVLEKDYHLSYPFVFHWNGNTYMIPETSGRHAIELYRAASFPYQWEFEKVLIDGITAVDATLAEISGLWWMFANLAVDGASMNDELHLFYADNPLGPWTPHRANPVKSDVRSARPAGRLFQRDCCWFRPAQDCSETYGFAISLNQILQINPDCYEEKEVARILPRWKKGLEATHTINQVEELTIVDGLSRRRKWL